jgi:hypothetical protein
MRQTNGSITKRSYWQPLVWFQMNKETDWRIDSSPASQAAFVTMANDPYFNP